MKNISSETRVHLTEIFLLLQGIDIEIKVDEPFQRANFHMKTSRMAFSSIATFSEQCQEHVVSVMFSKFYVFKPINIEMHHRVSNSIPNSEGELVRVLSTRFEIKFCLSKSSARIV